MLRSVILLIVAMILQGCTVGWYSLRQNKGGELPQVKFALSCPSHFEIQVESRYGTNTFGEKNARTAHINKIHGKLIVSTYAILEEFGCHLDNNKSNDKSNTLLITVTEQQQLSALPQEWLTGLSFGLIPSWGTRSDEWKFQFKLGDNSQVFHVDDNRFNHIIAFPVFWLSFPLMNIQSEYKDALRAFVKNY